MVANKRMKMPKRCADCPNEVFFDYYICCETNEIIDKNERLKKRLGNCPLVEIVTCKDCKYWNTFDEYCKYINNFTNKDFYCAGGEKKEDKEW